MSNPPSTPDLSRLRIDRSMTPSSPPPRTNFLALAAAAFGGALLMWLLLPRTASAPEKSAASPVAAQRPSTIDAKAPAAANSASRPLTLSATGYVVAQRKAAVSSKATGRLKSLHVVEGDVVEAGAILGELENDDARAVEREALAQLESARAHIRAAQADLEDAASAKKRAVELHGGRVLAKSELDTAVARDKRAAAEVEMANAQLRVAEAHHAKAAIDVEYTLIRSPFAGTVLTKDADVGEIVAPFGSAANARAAVVTMADMNSLEVEADIAEANLAKLHLGQEAKIVLDSFPSKTYHGTLTKIVPTVDRAKATVMVKIRFNDRDASVIPEMSAKVEFSE